MIAMEKTEKALFKVVGMYCISCKPLVEKQLRNQQAVKKIDIDYMTDSVIVEFDPTFITKQEIKDRLEKSGYKFIRVANVK
jgi:Cu+-exporting ATPase